MNGAIGSMLNFRNVIGTVLGSAGLGLMIKNAVSAGDKIAEMAQRVGVSTDALQELSHAAGLSGASVEDLENGLRFLNKNLGEAQTGSEELAKAFKKIGVDPSKFRDAGEAIGAVADGINALGNQAQKTEALLAIFERGGNQLAILLGEGSAGIAKLREEARRLGIVLDSKTLKEAQRLADDFDRLAAVIKGNLTKALIDLGPILLDTMGLFAKFAGYARDLSQVYRDIFASNETASLKELSNRIVDVTDKIAKLNAVSKEGSSLAADPKRLAELNAELFALREKLRLRQAIEANPDRNKIATVSLSVVDDKQLKALEEFRKKLILLAIPDETARKMVELRMELQKLQEVNPTVAAGFRTVAAAMEEIISQRAAGEALRESAKAVDEALAAITKGTQDSMAAAKPATDIFGDLANAYKDVETRGRQLGETLADELTGKIAATETAFRSANAEFGRAHPTTEKLGESLRLLKSALNVEQELAAITAGTKAAIAAADEADVAFRKTGEALRVLVQTPLDKYTAQLQNINALYDAMAITVETRDRALVAAKQDLSDATEKVATSLQQQIDMLGMSEKAAAIYADQLKLGADATEEMRFKTADLSGALFELKKQQEESKKFYTDLNNIVVNTALTMSDALVDFAMTGKASFKEMADAIIKDILRIITKLLILKAIEMITQSFGGGIGGGTSSAAVGSGVGGMASGGIVRHRPGGTLKVLAEAGQDEAVIPLDRMNALGGGGDVTWKVELINQSGTPMTAETQQSTGPDGMKKLTVFLRQQVASALGDGSMDKVLGTSFGLRRRGVAR